MNILALCILSSNDPSEEASLQEEHLSAIRNRYLNDSIEETIVSSIENMEFNFKKAVDLCRRTELLMVCKESHRLTSSEACMLYLQEKPIRFKFMDFPALHLGPTLEAIIGLLQQQKIFRSENIKRGIKQSKKKMGNPRLKESHAIENATKERQRKSLVNLNNFYARKEIIKLRDQQKLSFTKIAKQLNLQGFKTRRDKAFHTKTVTRLYKSYQTFKEIKDNLFEGHSKLMTFDQGLRDLHSPDHLQIINWNKPTPNFRNIIPIHLRDSINIAIKTTIYNNQNDIVYQNNFPKGKTKIKIDVEATNNLYPGRHYIKIEAPESNLNICIRSFDLYKDIIDLDVKN